VVGHILRVEEHRASGIARFKADALAADRLQSIQQVARVESDLQAPVDPIHRHLFVRTTAVARRRGENQVISLRAQHHPVTLAADMPEDAELEAVIARSPLEGEPETRPGGLLSGLRKLFGRR